MTTIVWFRQDLRKRDNPALAAAAARGPIIPLFILDEVNPGTRWGVGGASRWWLHQSLVRLESDLGGLVLLRGDPRVLLPRIAREFAAEAVFWNRCYEPFAIARDTEVKASLRQSGIDAQSFKGNLLFEPWEIATGNGDPFKVYTPFWRACSSRPVDPPISTRRLSIDVQKAAGDDLSDWQLLPTRPNWAQGWEKLWCPGEGGAIASLESFTTSGLADYRDLRDRPDCGNVSRLSPHLHFGEISVRQLWARMAVEAEEPSKQCSVEKFRSELGWREFCHHLLYHFPSLPEANWRPLFDAYPWRNSEADLKAWQNGQTGYPLIDAGMRELWHTGWMHNRVRMIAASFLTKQLRLDWRIGEAWFWDTLVDADLASNAANWQWVAGTGADAAPYFRIFNPIVQAQKFDPAGDYVRRWCPELEKLPTSAIHAPFAADPKILADAEVRLGETYPRPIVDLAQARAAALEGYRMTREGQASVPSQDA